MNSLMSAGEIHKAAKAGDLILLQKILENNPALLNSSDETGYTALHWALIRGKWETAGFLISIGADLNVQGGDGGTPLHCASNHDNTSVINTMLKKGAKLETKNLWGNTPLHLATERGCLETVQFLVSKGADISSASNEGWTPLHYAYMSGHCAIQDFLIEAGADILKSDSLGKIPYDYFSIRPAEMPVEENFLNHYAGCYYLGGDIYVNVVCENKKLLLEEYAVDELYPIGVDRFYDKNEPWEIRFFRNSGGAVDKIAIDFQRQTVVGKKVNDINGKPERLRLGVRIEKLKKGKLPPDLIEKLFYDYGLSSNAQLVTFIQPGSPADQAGLKVNDIIAEFNNKKILNPGDLQLMLYDLPLGLTVPVLVIRNGVKKYLNITFEQ